ncbi:MAG: sigma 54-interacting transcriptional regulator [SAR324 cluster bacterium]|nr:sigma 54-interacting transcriptional regulator [SAR324 cluster bacterium]
MSPAKNRPQTLAELKDSGPPCLSIREEMRNSLMARLESKEPLFPGIIGYENTVVPKIENAILSGHDTIFLGERGQGKSRIIRALVSLMDEYLPVIKGSEVNDNPFAPISRFGRDLVAEHGDKTPIEWIHRSRRYAEKLATPDTGTAELIGEIDPIKVAEGRYLSDELTIHYGLIPRVNRGIFAINELPDLSEKVQVSLFNILEERDVQIKGYSIRLPLDIIVVATANPEDYTSRGRIITPLKDRYSAHIRTHYPLTREVEIEIVEQEITQYERPGLQVIVPRFMKEVIAEITFQARNSPEVSQVSGVSVRMSINNMETLIANAEKRALRNREQEIVPRPSDLEAILATTDGKLELEYSGQEKTQEQIVQKLIQKAVMVVFSELLDADEMELLVSNFQEGWWVEVSQAMPVREYANHLAGLKGMGQGLEKLNIGESPGEMASAVEFILEGLHLHNRLNKEFLDGKIFYNEANKVQPLGRNSEMA